MIKLSKERVEKRIEQINYLLENFREESEFPLGESPSEATVVQYDARYTGQECDFEIMEQLANLKLLRITSTNFIPSPSDEIFVCFVIHSKEKLREYLLELRQMIKPNKPLIRLQTLQLIAKKIGELNSGTDLIIFLRDCGVDEKKIEYPQTKWRMIFSILEYLALSTSAEDRKILFTILESACHPLMHKGSSDLARTFIGDIKQLIRYDNLDIDDRGILWTQVGEDGDLWVDKDGNAKESQRISTFPESGIINPDSISKSDRELELIWTGFDLVDAQNKDCSILLREGFPKDLLMRCFANDREPRRILPRSEFDTSPKDTKDNVKALVANWSNKFQVTRKRIKSLVYYENKDQSIHITENIRFGKKGI